MLSFDLIWIVKMVILRENVNEKNNKMLFGSLAGIPDASDLPEAVPAQADRGRLLLHRLRQL
jgi:hypothetical protein